MSVPWDEIVLTGETLRAVMLPGKGAEIISLVDRRSGVELLARLRPTPPDDGTIAASGNAFDRWYAGGWQLMLPNGDRACLVDGVEHAFHGEAWARRWAVRSRAGNSVQVHTTLATLPLSVTRSVQVDPIEPVLRIETAVTNTGAVPVGVLWGEHPAFGAPLVGEGARLVLPPCTVDAATVDSRSRLAPIAGARWPNLTTVDGSEVDLSEVPGRSQGSHDVCITHPLPAGWYELRNDALGLGVRVRFDLATFRRLWIWQLYGAADDDPFRDGYCLAVEPFSGPPCLGDAIATGEIVSIASGATRESSIELSTFRVPSRHLTA